MSDDRPLGFCPKCEAALWLDDGADAAEPHDCEDEVTGDE